jgi:hypothetical protein
MTNENITPAEVEQWTEFHAELAKLTPGEQQALGDWKPPAGLVVNNRGLVAILSWLSAHSFPVTAQTLQLAVGQNRVQPFLSWEHISTAVQSEHSRTDDGTRFLGQGLRKLPDGSYGKTRADCAREAREAAEKANPQATQESLSTDELRWKSMACEKRDSGNTHSQRDQLKRAFDNAVAAGRDWRRVYESVNSLYNQMRKNEMIADRSRYYRR